MSPSARRATPLRFFGVEIYNTGLKRQKRYAARSGFFFALAGDHDFADLSP